jgi:cell division protein FtsN
MSRPNGRSGSRPAARRPASSPMPGWIWGLIGLSLGLAVAALVYIGRPAQPMPGSRPDTATRSSQPTRPTPTPPRAFTFYELLPNQEVVVPPRESSAPPPASAADAEYLIQVASYRNPQDAERQKAALALLGMEARVETVTIDGRETFYRVRLGPVKGLAAAEKMVAELNNNGIEALLVKVR